MSRWEAAFRPLSTINTLGSGFNYPAGVAVDGAGDVFVSDMSNIKEIVAVGGSIPTSPTIVDLGTGCGTPAAVAVDASGRVFDGCPITDVTGAVVELDYAEPPSLNFAPTKVGILSSDSPQTVAVFNDGNATLTFPVPAAGDNPSLSSSFLLDSASTCAQTTSSSSTAFTLAAGKAAIWPSTLSRWRAAALAGALC